MRSQKLSVLARRDSVVLQRSGNLKAFWSSESLWDFQRKLGDFLEHFRGKRVGFLVLANSFGGAERRYLRLMSFLARHHIHVTLFCNPAVIHLARQNDISIQGVEVVQLNRILVESDVGGARRLMLRLLNVRGWLSMVSVLRSSKLNHLHIVSNPEILVLFLSSVRKNLPGFSFCIFGNDTVDLGKKITIVQRAALSLGAKVATRVDCLTPRYQDFARSFSVEPLREKFVLAPCSFTDYSQVRTAPNRDIDVLFLGRFVEGKGLNLLAEVWPDLARENFDVHVCGDGPLRDMAPGPNVYTVTNSFSILARTKVFLSIQEKENYPSQSLLEAMGSGCAIVATDVGCTRDLLNESNSILVPPEASAIFGAIKKLLDSPDLSNKLGKKAREKAVEHFTIERYADYFVREVLRF